MSRASSRRSSRRAGWATSYVTGARRMADARNRTSPIQWRFLRRRDMPGYNTLRFVSPPSPCSYTGRARIRSSRALAVLSQLRVIHHLATQNLSGLTRRLGDCRGGGLCPSLIKRCRHVVRFDERCIGHTKRAGSGDDLTGRIAARGGNEPVDVPKVCDAVGRGRRCW